MTRLFSQRHMVVRIALIGAVFALVTAACSENGEGGAVVSSIAESGEVTVPEVTTPPDAPPATEEPPAAEAPAADEDNTPAFLVGLVLIVLIAVLIGTAIGGRSRKRDEPHRPAQGAQRNSEINNMLATASWLHDSASLDLLSTQSGQLAQQWQSVRPRAADLQTQAAALAMGSGSPELDSAASTLSQAAGSFAGAMDGYVAMQTSKDAGEAVTAELQAEAKSGVMARRQELQRAIGLVSAAR